MIFFRASKLSLIAFLLCFSALAGAQEAYKCSRASVPASQALFYPDQPKRPFDVLHYDLTLYWNKIFTAKIGAFTAENIITLDLTSDQSSSIELDAADMDITSVSVNNIPIIPAPQPAGNEKLIILIPQAFRLTGQQIVVKIIYSRDITKHLGFYFYPKGTADVFDTSIHIPETIAYTMSEPTDAHHWMPCMDLPYDKATSEISIVVPNSTETASNGDLVSKTSYDANSTIWHWKNDVPITTYLMAADASNYIHWSEMHHSSPADSVKLEYYAWPDDYYQDSVTDWPAFNATHAFRNTSQTMTWLEARFGRFPFSKYGQVPAQPFYWGGMEHQTLTTIHRNWFRGDQGQQGIAHEMAHQWFGDKTTCETFKDIWLNEGFATFSESQWAEGWGGYQGCMDVIRSKARDYFAGKVHDLPIYDPPADNVFNGALTYSKGACVLHMLRRLVGNDTMFFNSIKDYSDAFAYTIANTVQLRDYLSTRLGMDLTEYFDEWIFGRLHPNYDISWAQNAGNMFYLRINQIHDVSIRDHFTMPVKVFAFHGEIVDTLTYFNNMRSQRFQQMLSYTIDSLKFDDDALILSEFSVRYAPELDVRSAKSSNTTFEVYKEGNELLCKFSQTLQSGKIELYNSLGAKIQSAIVLGGETYKKIDVPALSSGIYFLHYSSGFLSEVRSVNITR